MYVRVLVNLGEFFEDVENKANIVYEVEKKEDIDNAMKEYSEIERNMMNGIIYIVPNVIGDYTSFDIVKFLDNKLKRANFDMYTIEARKY